MSLLATRPRLLLSVFVLFLGLSGAGALRLLAQQTPTRTVGTAGSGSTTVRFLAVSTDDGKPVTDLTAADVVLKVDGKARVLKSLDFVSLASPAHAAAPPAESLPPPFTTNTGGSGPSRSVMFVVDLETIPSGGEVLTRDAIGKFLNGLGPNDQAGIQGIPHGGISVDLTSDLNRVRLALPNLIGQAVQGESASDGSARSLSDLVQLQGILDNFSKTETYATVVYITSSLYGVSATATMSQTGGGGRGVGASNNIAGSLLTQDYFDSVKNAAAAAQVQFFIVEPTNRAGATSGMNGSTDGIGNLAAAVGAQPMQLALPNNETAMDRILRETSGYYVATFDPETNERNGFAHGLGLSSSRKGVTLRVTENIALPKPSATKAGATTSASATLGVATKYRDLPLRAAAYARRNADPIKTVLVMGIAEPIEPGTRFTAAVAGMYDKGKLVAQYKADSAALANPTFIAALVVAPGTYRLRMAATDSAGRTGTVDIPVDTALATAGPLKMSSLVLCVPSATVPCASLALQFTKEPVVTAAFELYGLAKGQPQITMTAELAKTLDGPAIEGLVLPGKFAGTDEPDKVAVTFSVPIDKLEPGDYIVRIVGGLEGMPTTRITHTLRKIGG